MTSSLVFFLEELSARDLLEGLLPRMLPPNMLVKYLVFEGKQDLEKQITRKMRAWLLPGSKFVILRDQDSGDCREVRRKLVEQAAASGRDEVLVRVACRELESWVLGDWEAAAEAFEDSRLADLRNKAVYRNPDLIHKPVEELRKWIPAYQKRDGARRIGPLLVPERTRSPSFRAFCDGVMRLVAR